jgi:aminoglycoside 3-N-acetyltransferase I
MSYEIRRLGAGDVHLLEATNAMFGRAFEDPDAYVSKRPSPAYLARLLGGESFVAVCAIAAGEVVGGLAGYVLEKFEQERREIYLYDLAVDVAHRRKGIATALIRELCAIARDRGAYVVYVQADLADDPAIALYTRLGTREEVLHFDIPIT